MFLIFVTVAHHLYSEVTPDMTKGIAPHRQSFLLMNTLVKKKRRRRKNQKRYILPGFCVLLLKYIFLLVIFSELKIDLISPGSCEKSLITQEYRIKKDAKETRVRAQGMWRKVEKKKKQAGVQIKLGKKRGRSFSVNVPNELVNHVMFQVSLQHKRVNPCPTSLKR